MQNTEKNLGFSNSSTPLIRVEQNEQGVQLVSARELYAFLGVKTDFSEWCKRMFEYGFVENQDYSLLKIGERSAHNKIDYALTLDTAKEIAMIQRSTKGREARQYFIECEKELRQIQQNPKHQLLSPEIQQILLDIQFIKRDNQQLREIINHLVDVSENRAYIPYKEAKPLSKHYVYFAFNPDNNLTKIGRSQEPEARMKAFKATSPNITITLVINVSSFKVACALETTLHAIFASKHKSGELFELLDSDFKAIELLKDSLENLI